MTDDINIDFVEEQPININFEQAGITTFLQLSDTFSSFTGRENQVLIINSSGTGIDSSSAGTGDVVGPASSTDNAIARFDSTTGKVVQNSLATISDLGLIEGATNTNWDAAYSHSQLTSGNPHSVTPTELGLVIGTNVQAWDEQLDSLAGLTPGIEGRMITSDGLGNYQISSVSDVRNYLNVEDGSEANNISDINATDLTDGGDSTLHYHASDRNRTNHTGTQIASTISDFDTEVSNNTDVAANTSYRGVGHIPLSQKAANNGVATLDAGGKIPANQLPSTVMDFKGTWNASTNTPTLADGTGDAGDVYLTSVAGSQDLGSGSITFAAGDWAVYNGSIWEKSINSNAVVSVNSQTGTVVLDADDIDDTLTTNKFVTATDITNLGNLSGSNSGDVTVTDTAEIDLTLTGQDIQASIKTGSIDILKLDSGVQTSLGKADSALQSETDPLSLHLDQTTPQSVVNGAPIFDAIKYNTSYTQTGSETAGTSYWDDDCGTLSDVLENGVIGQRYQEAFIRAQNNTGSTLANGTVATYESSIGNSGNIRIENTVASADEPPMMTVGIITEPITNGSQGMVTTRGKVRGIQTDGANYSETWVEGDILYKSSTVAGGLTNVAPNAPIPAIPLAVVISAHGSNGTLLVRPSFPSSLEMLTDVDGSDPTLLGDLLTYNAANEVWDRGVYNINDYIPKTQNVLLKEPTGFDDPSAVTINYDTTARTVTVTGTFVAYWQGDTITALVDGWVSEAHADLSGTWFLYYDGADFVWSQTPWTFDKLQIAFAYQDGINFGLRECHGLMPHQTHKEFHETTGTYKTAGADLSGYTVGSTTAAERRPLVSAATIYDEDLMTTVNAITTEAYTTAWLTTTGIAAFNTSATDIVPLLSARPYYNEFTGGAWTQTLMSNNSYMTVWLVAMPTTADTESQAFRYLWIQGQSEGSLAEQQALTVNDLNKGDFDSLSPEYVFTTKVIIRYTGGSWSITSVENITGTKFSQSTSVGTFLSTVAVDGTTIIGDGTVTNPIEVANPVSPETTGFTITAGTTPKTLTVSDTASVTGSNTGDQVVPSNEAGASNNFLTAYNSSTGAFTKAQPTEANLSLSDITTNDVSATKHGLFPKLPSVSDDKYYGLKNGAVAEISISEKVAGPASAVDDNIATFDLTTGKLIQDSGINISAVIANTAKVSNVTTNITVVEAPTNVEIQSSDGTNDTIAAADTTNAGVMTKAMYDNHILNNAKVTNATHTGDVTGSGALTVDKTAITGKGAVTAEGADYVLISDTSDTGNLKKALVSDFGGSGGLTNFTEEKNTTAPNATVPAVALKVDVTETNADAVLQPKGTGAILAQIPDSTATGGNKRGESAVDLQMIRSNATDVATGDYSTIGGGGYNNVSNVYGTVGGGFNNNTTSYGTIGGGDSNVATSWSAIGGGKNNRATAEYSCVPGGFYGNAKHYGAFATAAGLFADYGDAQYLRLHARVETTDAQVTELFLNKTSSRLILSSGDLWTFEGQISGKKQSSADSFSFKISGSIVNNGGTVTLNNVTVIEVFKSTSTVTLSVTADTTNDALKLEVDTTGVTGKIRWFGYVDMALVRYT